MYHLNIVLSIGFIFANISANQKIYKNKNDTITLGIYNMCCI
jgi:hypothetical protein